jgi:hypothetical protein
VVPFLVALTFGRPEVRPGELGYLWTDWHIVAQLALAAVGLVAFIAWELKAKEPLVDLRLFKNRVVAFGCATVFVMGGAFLTPSVFLPLFMVNVVGVTATASGLTISPLVLGVVAGNVLSGQLVSRIGRYKPLMLVSYVLLLSGFAVMALTLTPSSTQGEVTVKMVLLGLGLGPSIPLYTIAIQNAVPPQQVGVTTSMITFFRQMGSTVGIAVVGSLFATTLSHELPRRLAEATQGLPPELVSRFAAGPRAAGEEGGAPPRFDADEVKRKLGEQLEGAVSVATRALEGELLARQLVRASPFASPELKAAVEEGGVREGVRARFTVARARLRRAAESDEAWGALAAELPGVALGARPADEARLTEVDALLEGQGAAAAERAVTDSVRAVKAQVEAQRPRLFAAVDAAALAIKASFTEAILAVYRVAFFLALLALLLTLPLPQLPLRTTLGPTPPPAE